MLRILLSLITILLSITWTRAGDADTLGIRINQGTWVDRAPLESAAGVLAPVALFDLAFFRQDFAVRQMCHHYIPGMHSKVDYMMISLPAVAMWSMRLAGVEGRSESHLEALSAQGLSVALALGISTAGKEMIARKRPDGSPGGSFPSRHTASTFAIAAVVDAEYGDRYPWLSALSYGVATGVGISRIGSDRHWASDVVTGAGEGLFSTYIGYLLNDFLWGRGIERFEWDGVRDPWDSPYYISIDKGFSSLLARSDGYQAEGMGNSLGVTARIPLYRQVGFLVSGAVLSSKGKRTGESLHGFAVMAGADWMQGVWDGRLWLDGHLSLGYLSEMRLSEGNPPRSESIPFIAPGPFARVGVGAMLMTAHHFALKIDGGYNYAPLSRAYSRQTKQGLQGVDVSVGLTYIID